MLKEYRVAQYNNWPVQYCYENRQKVVKTRINITLHMHEHAVTIREELSNQTNMLLQYIHLCVIASIWL